MAGTFETSAKCKVKFALLELNYTAKVSHNMHVNDQNSSYGLIIARDLLSDLGIIQKSDRQKEKWLHHTQNKRLVIWVKYQW